VFSQISSQGFPVAVLRTYQDIEDFLDAATSTAATISIADDRAGQDDPVNGTIHGAGAGEDSDRPDHYIGTVQRQDTRGRAKARRGKRMDRRGE